MGPKPWELPGPRRCPLQCPRQLGPSCRGAYVDEHPVRLPQGARGAFGVDLQVRLPVEDGQGEPQSEHGDGVADQRLPCFPLVALHFLGKEEARDGQEFPRPQPPLKGRPRWTNPESKESGGLWPPHYGTPQGHFLVTPPRPAIVTHSFIPSGFHKPPGYKRLKIRASLSHFLMSPLHSPPFAKAEECPQKH